MNKGLTLSVWDTAVDILMGILNLIPKFVYFIFTAFTSGIDAMQALVRKLAGLDTYYSASGDAFHKVDPLTEFIYGILGIGNSSTTYKALNTVFWSLAIFALIVLVVSTMIAMIKSHYSEDTAGTSPWKFIYTAIKAILTFAIIPLVVIFGMKLSNFALVTLDNITTSIGTEEQVRSIYGPEASDIFKADTIAGSDEKTYIHYDIFGYGMPTSNTPMGSILFKAAAYSCNRARSGSVPYAQYQLITTADGKQIFGSSTCQSYSALTTDEERAEYIAYQIDYAFSNNLRFNGDAIKTTDIKDITDEYVSDMNKFNLFGGGNVQGFSKYEVEAVFQFYNLWTFNYIVAFGGGISIFGILLSIILGLMTRLVKGAALFLIYPPLLGLAPLDNFKAFKSWGTTMLQQILMAFGAIIGMNLVMLILPYLQNIAFFNLPLLDVIIQMLLLIVALVMTKDFIGMFTGFVGGADAIKAGDDVKGATKDMLKKGATITGKLGGGVARTMKSVPGMPIRAAQKIVKHRKALAIDRLETGKLIHNNISENKYTATGMINDALKAAKSGDPSNAKNKQAAQAAKIALDNARKKGITDQKALDEIATKEIEKSLKSQTRVVKKKNGKFVNKNLYTSLQETEDRLTKANKKYEKAVGWQDDVKEGRLKLKDKNRYGAYTMKGADVSSEKKREDRWDAIKKKLSESIENNSTYRHILNLGSKSIGVINEGTGLDKTYAGLTEIFKTSLTFKGGYDTKETKKVEGDDLQKKIAEEQAKEGEKQTKLLEQIATAVGAQNNTNNNNNNNNNTNP